MVNIVNINIYITIITITTMLRNGTMRIRGRIVGLPTTHHHHPSRCASHAATPRSFTPNPPIAPPTSHTDTSTPPSRPPTTLPSPRIDLKAITANPKAYTANHIARRVRIPSDTVFHVTRLHTTALEIRRKLDTIRNKQRDVGQLIRMGGGEDALLQARKLKTRVMEYEKALMDTEAELQDLVELLPNTTHPEVPLGDESHAVQLERFGPEIIPADPRRDHLDICTRFGWVDSPSSALATGTSWPYLKGTLAILEQALVQYALSISIRYGFTPVQTPDVIKEDIMSRCGFRPRDSSGQTYHISTSPNETSHLVLAATAEIPLAALSADQILPCLPRRLVGHGRAFRAEAGARGADTRGLYRVHQFTKVELFAVTAEEESEAMMEELRAVQKEIFKGLGLSCR